MRLCRPEKSAALERHPNYRPGFPENAPDCVVLRFVEDASQAALALEAGDLGVAWRSPNFAEAARLAAAENLTICSVGSGQIFFLTPNHTSEPFDDRRIEMR